ncbi:MAG: C10 family peptidase [Syntrophobacteraceae bacterium]
MNGVRAWILLVAFLFVPINGAIAAPTNSEDARLAVSNWLRKDAKPLGTELGREVREVMTFHDKAGHPLYHIVYLNSTGFVVVAGDDLVEPIILFAPGGAYDPSITNPVGALVEGDVPARVLDVREEEQKALRNGLAFAPSGQSGEAKRKWDWLKEPGVRLLESNGLGSISDVRVAPLVQSRWGQSSAAGYLCYNYYTPNNYVCGCVATAAAQLMRYHSHPVQGVGAETSYYYYVDGEYKEGNLMGGDGSGGPYAWNNMPLVPDSSITPTQCQAIGALTRDAGLAVNMSYTSSLSGSNTIVAGIALRQTFLYSNSVGGRNYTMSYRTIPTEVLSKMINPNLDASLPVLLGITGPYGGHAILSDGYGYNASTLYHHLNMGWSGSSDAWYNLPTVETDNYTFNALFECVYNIYVTGSGEIISGRVTDPAGNPVEGASITATRSGGGTYTAITNSRGIYAIPKIPSNSTYNVIAVKDGFSFTAKDVSTQTSVEWLVYVGNVWGVDFKAEQAGFDMSPVLMLLLSE